MTDEVDRSDIDASKAPLLDHLIELRGRLLRCVVYFVIAFAACFSQAGKIFDFLVQPLVDASGSGARLIYTKLYEAFFVEIRVAAFAGICIAFPLIANELWRFVAPGLYKKEQRALLPFLILAVAAFHLRRGAGLLWRDAGGFPLLPGFPAAGGGERYQPRSAAGDG